MNPVTLPPAFLLTNGSHSAHSQLLGPGATGVPQRLQHTIHKFRKIRLNFGPCNKGHRAFLQTSANPPPSGLTLLVVLPCPSPFPTRAASERCITCPSSQNCSFISLSCTPHCHYYLGSPRSSLRRSRPWLGGECALEAQTSGRQEAVASPPLNSC